jgi:hypothetical protein
MIFWRARCCLSQKACLILERGEKGQKRRARCKKVKINDRGTYGTREHEHRLRSKVVNFYVRVHVLHRPLRELVNVDME